MKSKCPKGGWRLGPVINVDVEEVSFRELVLADGNTGGFASLGIFFLSGTWLVRSSGQPVRFIEWSDSKREHCFTPLGSVGCRTLSAISQFCSERTAETFKRKVAA